MSALVSSTSCFRVGYCKTGFRLYYFVHFHIGFLPSSSSGFKKKWYVEAAFDPYPAGIVRARSGEEPDFVRCKILWRWGGRLMERVRSSG